MQDRVAILGFAICVGLLLLAGFGQLTVSYAAAGPQSADDRAEFVRNEGSTYFESIDRDYLLSVVKEACGVHDFELKSGISSGMYHSSQFVQKRIGFHIAREDGHLTETLRLMGEVLAKLRQDVSDTLDVNAPGLERKTAPGPITYRAGAITGVINVISRKAEDGLYLEFLFQEHRDERPRPDIETIWPLLQAKPKAKMGRIIRFPANKSLGSLHVRDENMSWLMFEPWKPLGEAKGYVVVPPGQALLLDMADRTDEHDFSPLGSLRPQDLQALVVQRTNVDIRVVSRMNDLRWLLLAGTKVRDHELSALLSLSKLERLDLSATSVTDEGVVYIANVDTLKDLTLGGDLITDECIPHLLKLHRLERLDLRGTGVSEEGAERLENGLPNCRIQH